MKRSNRVLQLVLLVLLGLSTCASTPGYVGGCNTASNVVDPGAYCSEREATICARTQVVEMATGNPDAATNYAACAGRVAGFCAGANWPVGCAPSPQTTNACLAALVDGERIFLPVSDLGECSAVCSGAGGGVDPDGI